MPQLVWARHLRVDQFTKVYVRLTTVATTANNGLEELRVPPD